MPSTLESADDKFTFRELRVDGTVLIVITCKTCRAAKIVSHFDGSLEEWEHKHRCEVEAKAG